MTPVVFAKPIDRSSIPLQQTRVESAKSNVSTTDAAHSSELSLTDNGILPQATDLTHVPRVYSEERTIPAEKWIRAPTGASSSRTTAETIDELLHRVSTLESIVSQLSDASKLSHPTPPAAPSHEPSIIRSSFGTDTKDEDVAMMLEDFAMGHRVNTNRAAQELEAASHSTDRSPQLRVTRKGPQLGILPSHPLALLIDPNTDILGRLLSVMLPEQQAGVLVQFYFDRLDWYSKVLHRPTFVAESKNLWANISSRNFAAIDIGFLAVYYMVLCLALHLIESIVREQLGLSFLAASDLARDMHSAAQACLHFDEFLGSHSLEHLQCIILMGVYQQNLDESDTHWALLGAAIKIAQNLAYPCWAPKEKNEIIRHPGALSCDERLHAEYGGFCQNHTGFPANVNDMDLVDGIPFKPHPPREYTEMTFSLWHSFIVEMDSKISCALSELPTYFRGPGPAVKGFELTLALIMGETRRLRLHRPFLFRGYKDKKYMASRVQCVASATAILNHLNSDDSALLLKWWIVLFYGFAAAVVLFIDLCHQKAEGQADLEGRRMQLREALDLFKTAEQVSHVSRNAITLLEGLLTAEPGMPSRPSHKRGATDDAPFGRIVKRMIIDASRNLTVPTAISPASSSSANSASPPMPPIRSQVTRQPETPDMMPELFMAGGMFRDEGVFSGPHFDDQTMAQLSQLLYSDPYGYTDNYAGSG
ncbi:unnamed protein product [Mycena citricolor]|uniref:Xylanolytic transcriptional activator regulatory domain-containing protein n=1 Tax=Mycena citricolor TaxID=2018698 RepID=A0AAD2GV56_9AGAR|nr:unnamed protein product [Mycena citricolor]